MSAASKPPSLPRENAPQLFGDASFSSARAKRSRRQLAGSPCAQPASNGRSHLTRASYQTAPATSGPPPRRAAAEPPGDEMRDAQRLGELALRGGRGQQRLGLGPLHSGALHEYPAERLHRTGALDQRPLATP